MNSGLEIVVVDDHPLFREGAVHALTAHGITVVAEGATADDAIRLSQLHEPDLVLLDINLPGGVFSAMEAISARSTKTRVLALTVSDDKTTVASAIKAGASGYVLKGAGAKEVVAALKLVAEGNMYVSPQLVGDLLSQISDRKQPENHCEVAFTDREEQILSMLAQGLSNKEMAFELDLSEKTIKFYLTHVLRKLHVRNRVEAAIFASKRTSSYSGTTSPR